VEADRDLDGGGPGPGSSDNLTLDLVSAAAANASSLIKKMTRGAVLAPLSADGRYCCKSLKSRSDNFSARRQDRP
jgi:hypothetical protein